MPVSGAGGGDLRQEAGPPSQVLLAGHETGAIGGGDVWHFREQQGLDREAGPRHQARRAGGRQDLPHQRATSRLTTLYLLSQQYQLDQDYPSSWRIERERKSCGRRIAAINRWHFLNAKKPHLGAIAHRTRTSRFCTLCCGLLGPPHANLFPCTGSFLPLMCFVFSLRPFFVAAPVQACVPFACKGLSQMSNFVLANNSITAIGIAGPDCPVHAAGESLTCFHFQAKAGVQ